MPDPTTPERPAEELTAAANTLLSAAKHLEGAVGTPPESRLTRVLRHAREINALMEEAGRG